VPTHQQHAGAGTYFVTFTCYYWLPLFELTNTYKSVYNWFNIIQSKGARIVGYVVMPNHVHCLIHLTNEKLNLNKLVRNGKRFMAYEIVKILHLEKDMGTLNILQKE
jgi:REP element-mobilizing transposase RayT